MTNEEKIRQIYDTDALAKFIMALEMMEFEVPKKYGCCEMNCISCKDDLSCYKEWLRKENKDERCFTIQSTF